MTSKLKGLHLHFDPQSGIAGDMTVAALIDAGVPRAVVTGAIAAMRIPDLKVTFERRRRGAFMGTGFVVRWPGMNDEHGHSQDHQHDHGHGQAHAHAHEDDHEHSHDHDDEHAHEHAHDHAQGGDHASAHEHRRYSEIQKLLRRADLPAPAKALAAEIFSRIAQVESELHGIPLARIAFHEVGAFDSIADVVGAAAAIAWLEPAGVTATAPVLGTGTVRTAHGRVAVPAPATAALLRGLPVRSEGQGELTTPTGAAILAAVVREFRDLPPVRLQAQGFGAGTRELADRPNVLRVMLGEPIGVALPPSLPQVTLLAANVDDMSPQLVEPLMTALFAAGALDVWVTSILMKKGRPGLEISALAGEAEAPAVARAFFPHSSTLGVRQARFARTVLARATDQVQTRFGQVSVKVAALDGQVLGVAPEFEDARRVAAKAGVPVREVLAEAAAAGTRLPRESGPPRRRLTAAKRRGRR
jgi:pyridinium-3,5-bisthiocarboxylic acid mononucleotide nickel chelatase